jgi:hypothetical protein
MEIFAISMLAIVAGALAGVGFYAIFGKPSTASGKKRKQHVVSGFQIGGGVLLGMLLTAAFIGSMGAAFFRKSSTHSKPLVFVVLILSLVLIALLEDRWAKYFAGWVGYGVWNGLLMASSGHLVNNPAVSIARSTALQMTGLVFVTALVSLRFTGEYRLNLVDKTALLGWVVTMGVGAQDNKYAVPAMALGCVFVVLAWLYYRLQNRPARRHRARQHRTTTA